VNGELPDLVARESGEATRRLIEIAVEDVNLIVVPRNVFLQHQVRHSRVFHRYVVLEQLFGRADDHHLPSAPALQSIAVDALQHDRKGELW
jgi:hypothetical protein